jgi:hypothetical protein
VNGNYGVSAGEYYFAGCTSPAQCVFPNAVIPPGAWRLSGGESFEIYPGAE